MALTAKTETQTTVLPDGQIWVRTDRVVLEDGVEIARTVQRHVVDVGGDVSGEDAMVRSIAQAVHTPSRVSARQAALAESESRRA